MIKHAIPIAAHFDWALAVTFAAPEDHLKTLLARGLELDTLRGHGFLAAACVQTRRLRPAVFPAFLGLDFFLAGYRLFVRFQSPSAGQLRGLQILGSETDRWPMVFGGNLFTHYGYKKVSAEIARSGSLLSISTSSGLDIGVREEAGARPEDFFESWEEARRFAGPMPYTFASQNGGRRIVRVRGVRTRWRPRAVAIERVRVPFLERLVGAARPAATFLVEEVDYRWERGVSEDIG